MKSDNDPTPKRPYRMQARTQSAEETGRRILQAVTELYLERWLDQFSLDDVAKRSNVTVQTVLRRFGSKEGLIAAVGADLEQQVRQQRGEAPPGDVDGIVHNLFDHYEAVGTLMLRSLAQEGMHPALNDLMNQGRQFHYAWVEQVFAFWLATATGQAQAQLRAQLITLTDIYVWKLLSRDLGLERGQAELALVTMLKQLLKDSDALHP